MSSILIVLGLATNLSLEIEQIDVKMILTHYDLEEEIYMEQYECFKVNSKENFVCELYDLKQDPRQWYKKFKSATCQSLVAGICYKGAKL